MTVNVLKIGGGSGVNRENVLRNLVRRILSGEQWVVVHGTSQRVDELAAQAGLPLRTITSPGGHISRYTDAQMIKIYEQAVQDVNTSIVDYLTACNVPARGFATAGVVAAQRKAAIRAIHKGRQIVVRDDYSGRITEINYPAISACLADEHIPVIAPIALGQEGESLNVDGDLVAAEIARVLSSESLVILSNVPGLLQDVDDESSIVSTIHRHNLDSFQRFARGRMKRKLVAAHNANIQRVIIGDSRAANPLDNCFSGAGTHIMQELMHA